MEPHYFDILRDNWRFLKINIFLVFVFVSILSVCPYTCLSQSKTDTQDWIVMQLDRNIRDKPTKFEFINNELHIEYRGDYTSIPMKEVNDVRYEINSEYDFIEFGFVLKQNPAKYIISGTLLNGLIINKTNGIAVFIKLRGSSEKDNIAQRLVKAFKYLIPLSGGKAVSENTF